jgi:hypothetical protein
MTEKRGFIRRAAGAKARISAYTDAFVLLRDISRHGCCISCPDTLPASCIDPDTIREYTLEVFPEPGAAGKFTLIVQPCWTWIKDGMRETGCFIVRFPTKKDNENFTAYLAWQSCRK